MVWAKFDDQFYGHDKVIRAGPYATALFQAAVIHCCRNLTDGLIHVEVIERLIAWDQDNGALISRLVEVGLVEKTAQPGMLIIHDFLEYQISRAEVLEKRSDVSEKRSAAGKKGAAKRWQKDGKPIANQWQTDNPGPDPGPGPLDLYTGDEKFFEVVANVEAVGYPKYGSLTGTAIAKIKRLMPISGEELDIAMGTEGNSWGYAAKVIENVRIQRAKPPPPKAQKRRTRKPKSGIMQMAQEIMERKAGNGEDNMGGVRDDVHQARDALPELPSGK